MDKTININLGGSLFQIEGEAFGILRDYLQAINLRFRNTRGGNETIDDIESRIAEIFHSQKGLAGVITTENVQSMISIVGKPEDFDVSSGDEEQSAIYTSSKKKLYRNPDDTVIAGVCSGLAVYFNTDPVLLRILFVLFLFFGGAGFFVYLVLWLVIPSANSPLRKKEMYGSEYSEKMANAGTYSTDFNNGSHFGNGLNEVFKAFGKFFFILFRIVLAMLGVSIMLTGFLSVIAFMMIFVFHYPGAFYHHGFNFNPGSIPEFIHYVVSPAAAPWIIALTTIVFILPMLALIYWGVRMIFWFRVKDGIFNLTALLLWVIAISALSIILFNEGVSFAESASTTIRKSLPNQENVLHIVTNKESSSMAFDKEFAFDDEGYNVFLLDSSKRVYIRPKLRLGISDDNQSGIEIRRRSAGRTRSEATKKSESLLYNYRISNDTLYLDKYFSLPKGEKWTADFVTISLFLPENSKLSFDTESEKLLHNRVEIIRNENGERNYDVDYISDGLSEKTWTLTTEGLEESNLPTPSK
jgi:phage shock protein PspC (stress-responsive transcriptional regulator)